jgi:hypothetical protein
MKMMAKLIALMLALSVLICSLASCDALAENFGDILSQIGQGIAGNGNTDENGSEADGEKENGESPEDAGSDDSSADEEAPKDPSEDENDGTDSDESVTDKNEEGDEDEASGEGSIPDIPSQNPSDFPDPYRDVDKEEFYANYKPAESYVDAYYRTRNGLMSGSIEPQDQYAALSEYRPSINGVYLKNTDTYYSEDGNTYALLDAYGNVVSFIYRGGAYVVLEEVAAYVFAFGEVPANHSESKKTKPTESIWGEYLRVNHTVFTGDTSRYPYEPRLPRISGCGGDYTYYEMDIGTTGTTCDPSYKPTVYNNGIKITRGAARIVYSRYDRNGNKIIEASEKYLFYTDNHYNDFREYLNYEGGWGEIFGNITGGGSLSSKYDYAPTEYPEVVYTSFSQYNREAAFVFIIHIKEEMFV